MKEKRIQLRAFIVLYKIHLTAKLLSFAISDDILRNQKFIIGLDSFSNQRLIYLGQFG